MKKLFFIMLLGGFLPLCAMEDGFKNPSIKNSAWEGINAGVTQACIDMVVKNAPKVVDTAYSYFFKEDSSESSQPMSEKKTAIANHLETTKTLSHLIHTECDKEILEPEQHAECKKLKMQMFSLLSSLTYLQTKEVQADCRNN